MMKSLVPVEPVAVMLLDRCELRVARMALQQLQRTTILDEGTARTAAALVARLDAEVAELDTRSIPDWAA